jgi:hypothetical protein
MKLQWQVTTIRSTDVICANFIPNIIRPCAITTQISGFSFSFDQLSDRSAALDCIFFVGSRNDHENTRRKRPLQLERFLDRRCQTYMGFLLCRHGRPGGHTVVSAHLFAGGDLLQRQKENRISKSWSAVMGKIVFAVLLMVAAYCAYPFFAIWQIDRAIHNRDLVALESLIDWNSLRAGFKSDFKFEFLQKATNETKDAPLGAAIGALLLPNMIDTIIDGSVTARNFVQQGISRDAGARKPLYESITYAFFVSPSEFRIDLSPPNLPKGTTFTAMMSLTGASWKVSRVTFPSDLFKSLAQRAMAASKPPIHGAPTSPASKPSSHSAPASDPNHDIEALRDQIQACWNPPTGAGNASDLVVSLRVQLRTDGTLSADPQLVNRGSHRDFQVAAESAMRAVRRCQPYSLATSTYDTWKDVEITFDPH